jgi:hypothetical protein
MLNAAAPHARLTSTSSTAGLNMDSMHSSDVAHSVRRDHASYDGATASTTPTLSELMAVGTADHDSEPRRPRRP